MSQSQSLGDTPLKQSTGVLTDSTVEEQGAAVISDLGNIPEVTFEFMLDHIVPNSSINVGRTMQDLRRKGILLDAGWKTFIDALPNDSDDNEPNIFLEMRSIYRKIIVSTKFDVRHPPPLILDMGTCPDVAPVSETSRPNGCQLISGHSFHTSQCGYPYQVQGDYHWFNIPYVEEYKKKNSLGNLNDNILKILWSVHHMMNIDHRRRFAFGVTIENTDTRVWFCCREMVFVTQAFDFMEEPAKLVQLISSLAYADVVKLGYDPTMELFWNDGWNYRITIEGKDILGNIATKVYETVDIIADMSYGLCGRATHVYEAYDIETPEAKVVIKDSWVAANGSKEGDTLQEILDDASEDEKAMFLTVLLHGVVTIHGRLDLTRDLIMNGHQIVTQSTVESDHVHHASVFQIDNTKFVPNPASHVPFPTHRSIQQPHVYGPKAHYRIIFKERGESLYSLSCLHQIKLPLIVQAMSDILKALAFLTKKGYVHQDISPGNIIIYDGHAKLNDLEFAKKYYGTNISKHIRVGNYNFMAVEVASSGYLHHAKSKFSHNPLHDLESLWWMGVWFLLCHYKAGSLPDNMVQTHMKLIRTIANNLFNNGTNGPNRRWALFTPDTLAASDPGKFSQTVQELYIVMEKFRAQLDEYYEIHEPHDQSFFTANIHHQCGSLFEKAIEALKNDSTELWPLNNI